MDALKIIDPEVKEIFEKANSLHAILRAGKLAQYIYDSTGGDFQKDFQKPSSSEQSGS
jgi:hypothetical protein